MRTTDSADRVVDVLEALANAPDGLRVAEIGRAVGVHKATASRLLGTLARRGIVERVRATGRYRPGANLARLARIASSGTHLIDQARPVLDALAERTRETTNLAVLDDTEVLYIDQVTAPRGIVAGNWVGRRSPAHSSSSGKVLLAFGADELRERILKRPLERLAANTITDPERLRTVLARVRSRGYADSMSELEAGLNTVAAPIFAQDRVVAAVSISGPAFRFRAKDLPRMGRLAADAGTGISRRMRYLAEGGPGV